MKNITMKEVRKICLIAIAIIVVFALFCLYAIDKQKQRAVIEMADKILSSAEHYAMGQIMDNNYYNVVSTFPDNNLLNIKGNLPENGYVKILEDSRIEILFHYNGYCVSKSLDELDNSFKKMSKDDCLNNERNFK